MCGRAREGDPTAGVTNARGGADGTGSRGRARARIGCGHGEQQAEASGLRRVSATRGTQGIQGASGRRAQGGEGVQEGVPHMGAAGGWQWARCRPTRSNGVARGICVGGVGARLPPDADDRETEMRGPARSRGGRRRRRAVTARCRGLGRRGGGDGRRAGVVAPATGGLRTAARRRWGFGRRGTAGRGVGDRSRSRSDRERGSGSEWIGFGWG